MQVRNKIFPVDILPFHAPVRSLWITETRSSVSYTPKGLTPWDHPQPKEDAMDKIWLYLGSIIVGAAVLTYAAISYVSNTHPPANDLRAAYQQNK